MEYYIAIFFLNVYFGRERKRQSTSRGGAERERGKTQNRKQAPGSELSAQSPMQGSNSQAARS